MRSLALSQTALAVGVNLGAAGVFCLLRRFGIVRRRLLVLLTGIVLSSPLLILPRGAGLLRFIIAAMAVQTAFRLYDLHADPEAPRRPSCLAFIGYQFNPFAIVWRRVWAEPPKPVRNDLGRFLIGTSLGAVAIGLMVFVFHIDWARYPFVLEHCAKVISFLLVIQLLLNGLAAGYRLAGLTATDFAGNFFFSATPAEFWRRYNRPVEQFFYRYVFRPTGGLHRPLVATMAVFAFSAIVHEYIFDIAARRVLGYQMAFFLIHGVASTLTLRVRPKGLARLPAILLNTGFNLATAYLFFMSMNAFVPFYAPRI
ncbi:MAG TPA: MBOAT family O-acyltransferase [Tepidisphaeraceae bacterium]|nr:MBOAT family O-acyltransferase [Tepidisphaeraceae bacterium]